MTKLDGGRTATIGKPRPRLARGQASLRLVPAGSWIALVVTWLIWIINAFDREVILRLGPIISQNFGLSPEAWGIITAVIFFALAVMAIPGSRMSDRHGTGWKRAWFQVPLVIGYNLLSAISGVRAVAGNLVAFLLLRVGVNLGAGWGEPVGVSNTTEWWPKERRGFALGVHHTGYPVGALLSGLVAAWMLGAFGVENWSYIFFVGLIASIPVMAFWWWYSRKHRMDRVYTSITERGMTPPISADESATHHEDQKGAIRACLANKIVMLTSGTTLLFQIVYNGVSYILPLYLANIVGLPFADAAAYSVVFTITGILGQIVWPSISDYLGRRKTLIITGVWMGISAGAFYFAHSMGAYIGVQLLLGCVANAPWPIFYAAATDAAPRNIAGTANGFITTSMFLGGGLAPLIIGGLIAVGGGWANIFGYNISFIVMMVSAIVGVILQIIVREPRMSFDKLERSSDELTA